VRLSGALVAELLADPGRHFASARIVPGASGARVYGVRRADLLYRAGLRNGDVVESIDDVSVSSFDALVEVVVRALARGSLRVRIRRGHETIRRTLSFPPGAGVHPSA